MVDINKLKEKSPLILAVLGAVFILLHSLGAFKQYLFLDKIANLGKIAGEFFFQDVFDSILTNFVSSVFGLLLTSIIGLLLGVLLIVYVVKITKEPSKKKYTIITVLGVLALFFSSGIGGILAIIGGVIGIKRYS